jgi:hypothetical protein
LFPEGGIQSVLREVTGGSGKIEQENAMTIPSPRNTRKGADGFDPRLIPIGVYTDL